MGSKSKAPLSRSAKKCEDGFVVSSVASVVHLNVSEIMVNFVYISETRFRRPFQRLASPINSLARSSVWRIHDENHASPK